MPAVGDEKEPAMARQEETKIVLLKASELEAVAEVAAAGAQAAEKAAAAGAEEPDIARAVIEAALAKASDRAYIAKAAEAELGRIAETTTQNVQLHAASQEAEAQV